MTIDEIKSVSIIQFLETQGYHTSHVLKGNYWYLSPFRSEQSPLSMSILSKTYGMTMAKDKEVISLTLYRR